MKVSKAWVALSKFLQKSYYFADKTCQHNTFSCATLTFPVCRIFENAQNIKDAIVLEWVGQVDFPKIELNNWDQSGNCQGLKDERNMCNKVEKSTGFDSLPTLSLPWTDLNQVH